MADGKSSAASIVDGVRAMLLKEQSARIALREKERKAVAARMVDHWCGLVAQHTRTMDLWRNTYPDHPESRGRTLQTSTDEKVIYSLPFPTVHANGGLYDKKWGVMTIGGYHYGDQYPVICQVAVVMPNNSNQWVDSLMAEFETNVKQRGFTFLTGKRISWG